MAEYIEREALLDSICHETCRIAFCGATNCAFMAKVCSAPAADVAPVVHARWVDGKCSNCGVDIPTDDTRDAIFENECHFCYYCGAKMDGGDGDAAAAFAENCGATFVAKRLRDSNAFPEVVTRCKNCEHYRNHPNGLCYLHTEPKENKRGYSGEPVCVEPDDFCSYGEPKEG